MGEPRTLRCKEFVAEDAQGVDRGGFAAEDEGAERDGVETGGEGVRHFFGREVALGADGPGGAAEWLARRGGATSGKDGVERARAGVEAGD